MVFIFFHEHFYLPLDDTELDIIKYSNLKFVILLAVST